MKYALAILLPLLFSLAARSQSQTLNIAWPKDWKKATDQKSGKQILYEYIPITEDIDHWSILGNTNIFIGLTGMPIESPMNIIIAGAKKNAIHPNVSVIEKSTEGVHPWIIFKIEAEKFVNDPNPESELYYIIEGDKDLYSNFVAVKKPTLTKEFVDEWIRLFKRSEFGK